MNCSGCIENESNEESEDGELYSGVGERVTWQLTLTVTTLKNEDGKDVDETDLRGVFGDIKDMTMIIRNLSVDRVAKIAECDDPLCYLDNPTPHDHSMGFGYKPAEAQRRR